jgi:hypothetical protein
MKADMGVFGIPYHVELQEVDRAFLRDCEDVTLSAKPWNDHQLAPYQIEPLRQIEEEIEEFASW